MIEDYNNTEKIARLPGEKLSLTNAPAGYDPDIGDVTVYGPWGNIAIFYRDYGYSNGLVSIGKIGKEDINKLIKYDKVEVII